MLQNQEITDNLNNQTNMKNLLKREKSPVSKKITTKLEDLENFTISFWIKKKEEIKKGKNKKIEILSIKQGNKNLIDIFGFKKKLIFNIA